MVDVADAYAEKHPHPFKGEFIIATWRDKAKTCMQLLRHGGTGDRERARKELFPMAELADQHVAETKAAA
jgi:hypothetical protein